MILSVDISHLDPSWMYFHLRANDQNFGITASYDGCMRSTKGRTMLSRKRLEGGVSFWKLWRIHDLSKAVRVVFFVLLW